MKKIFSVLALLLLSACANQVDSGMWLSPAHERLYISQKHYQSQGRDDIGCYLPRIEAEADEVICTQTQYIPVDAVKAPLTRFSASTNPYPSVSSGSAGGGTVQVKGYYRKDGTYVRPHTRRAPRRK